MFARRMRPSRVVRAFLRPVDLSATGIDGDPDAPPRLVAAIGVASAGLDEGFHRRSVEVRAHDAHSLAIAPVQLAAPPVELELFGRERAPLGNDRLAIPPVEVGALDGAVIQIGDAHVGPVDVPVFDIDRDAIRHPALVDDDLAVGPSGFTENTRLPLSSRTNKRLIVVRPTDERSDFEDLSSGMFSLSSLTAPQARDILERAR